MASGLSSAVGEDRTELDPCGWKISFCELSVGRLLPLRFVLLGVDVLDWYRDFGVAGTVAVSLSSTLLLTVPSKTPGWRFRLVMVATY